MLDGVVYRDLRAVKAIALHKRVLDLAHEGHCGVVKVKQRFHECVCWPGIDHDVNDFVVNCTSCITSGKGGHSPPTPPVKPIPFPSKPWSKLSLDIIGELHGTPAYARYMLVCVELHSK